VIEKLVLEFSLNLNQAGSFPNRIKPGVLEFVSSKKMQKGVSLIITDKILLNTWE